MIMRCIGHEYILIFLTCLFLTLAGTLKTSSVLCSYFAKKCLHKQIYPNLAAVYDQEYNTNILKLFNWILGVKENSNNRAYQRAKVKTFKPGSILRLSGI